MKAGVFAIAAAAIASGVSAGRGHAARRHAHEAFHVGRHLVTGASAAPIANATCGCTTIYTTITGEGGLYFPPAPTTTASMAPPPPPPSSSAPSSSSTSSASPSPSPSTSSTPSTSAVTSTPTGPVVVPTPLATTCPTPGVYTIPATTVTLTSSTTVCAATSTKIPSGTQTYGGVTTIVSTATTVVCPYATVSTTSGVITSVIETTTYVCPSAGTYTIAPITTTVSTATVVVYPTPASYAPGTYTQPQVVTTITETDYVVFCPFTSPAPTPSSSSVYVAPPPKSTSVYVAPPPPSSSSVYVAPPSSSVYVAPPKSSAASSSSAPKSSSSSTPSTGGGLGSSGNQWAMTYSPYSDNGGCKSSAEIAIDVALIGASGFKAVRVYSTDCSGLQAIGTACKLAGMKMILGVFISETGISGAQQQVTDIVNWGQWNLVDLVVIGNECVFNGYATASALASFITDCKSKFSSAGYSGPCTTTEPLNVWQSNTGALCSAVDVVGANIHPFFNADVSAEDAGSFTASQLKIVDGLCPGKSGVNLETGWPSGGTCNGKACPGKSEQATAIKGIKDAVGGKSVMFSFTNDLWKAAGAFGCEQSWGAIDLFKSS